MEVPHSEYISQYKESGFVLHGKQNIPSPFSLKVLKHLAMSLTDRHKVIYGNSCYISLPPTPNPHTRIRRISHAVHHGCCCIFWRVCSNRSALPVSGNNDRPHVYERPVRRGGLCVKCLNPRVPVVCMDRDPQQRGRLMGQPGARHVKILTLLSGRQGVIVDMWVDGRMEELRCRKYCWIIQQNSCL